MELLYSRSDTTAIEAGRRLCTAITCSARRVPDLEDGKPGGFSQIKSVFAN
jgi:hypothetical protein